MGATTALAKPAWSMAPGDAAQQPMNPQFLAEADRRKIEINEPMHGEDARQAVDRLYAADPGLMNPGGAGSP